ncbi:putative histone-lysine N-methyltransferase [Rosa chinensis]|uniref:Putative histone-lysine N-methyltransferase n=1 Tax=Rosa chinensis TaxID=74649 RepID=A0A2P6SM07_ROSCH|nr:histone-lysine N-methyltransferase, H3 lysine-9 specific SUVH5 [Rosa chinensis]PRQ59728.1 putative histone-lysine N-methyltransferase [Rosa chinensis]
MVTLKTPEKENGFRPNFKRPRGYTVRDFPEGCGRFVAPVQPSECEEGDEDMNTLARNNCSLPSPRVDLDVVRDFPKGCGPTVVSSLKDAEEKSLVPDVKECEQRVVGHKLSVASVVDKAHNKVKKALAAYQETLSEMGGECDANFNRLKGWKLYVEAAMYLKKRHKWVNNTKKQTGDIPGVKVGDKFRYRPELAIVGLHSHFQCGIDYMTQDGEMIATSIVESGRYANETESPDVMIYTGQGGNPKVSKGEPIDQKPDRGNRALMNSKAAGNPVRVIRSYKFREESGYVYDGLYIVDDFWRERGVYGKFVFRFSLRRISGQPKLTVCNS